MKLNHLIPQGFTGAAIIQQFGQARLIRHRNGQHVLVGGSTADRTAAFEWVSLFAHEIVFSHFDSESGGRGHHMPGTPRLRPML